MDNGTMVEAFKYLNYCGLAKTSLVSKRFCNLICTHRHKLARLYVASIVMRDPIPFHRNSDPIGIKIFDKMLSDEEYNEWVILNQYSKQIPLETQMAGMQRTQNKRKVYQLYARVDYDYKDSETSSRTTNIFDARIELNHENWPAFQHLIRLLTDPFIHISYMGLPHKNDGLNLLAGAIKPDGGRLQCDQLQVSLQDFKWTYINWIKVHVRCSHIFIMNRTRTLGPSNSKYDKKFLNFFVTGANCTSSIYLKYYDPRKVIAGYVKKFKNLKGSDESKLVELIECHPNAIVNLDGLKRIYADFVIEGNINETSDCLNWLVFEFVNNEIGKKLRLSIRIHLAYDSIEFTLMITNL